MAVLWRIYYGDGSTYSNLDGSPFDAPTTNAQGVVHYDAAVGRKIVHRCDVYWYSQAEDCWYGAADRNLIGFWDHIAQRGPKYFLIGRSISDEAFDEVTKAMLVDEDFPPKSALSPSEF